MELNEQRILLISGAVFAGLVVLAAFFLNDIAVSANIMLIGVLVLFVPYSLYKFFAFKKIHAYEAEFPAFLRDVAESQRAGLSFAQALQLASKSEYGSLTPHVRKMSVQMSWNVPVERILESFSKKMEKSRIITRSLLIMRQANKTGGNIEETMESLANNIELLRDVQAEKATLLNQQVFMMYAIFFIFLGITLALVKFLVPLVQNQESGSLGLLQSGDPNPCATCSGQADIGCLGCSAFSGISLAFGLGKSNEPASYYKALFFTMIVVQGFFSGLIAGQIGSDSVSAGVKHSLIMLIAGIFIFLLAVRTGLI